MGADPLTLLLLGAAVVGGAVMGFFGLIALAAFIYIWTHAYPWLKMVGKWAARPLNIFSLVILAVILFVLAAFLGLFGLSGLLGPGGLSSLVGLLGGS